MDRMFPGFLTRYVVDYALISGLACLGIDACILLLAAALALGAWHLEWVIAIAALELLFFYILGLQHIIWRYIGFQDLKRFLEWAILSAVILMALSVLLGAPLWLGPYAGVLAFSGLISVRVLRRAAYEYYYTPKNTVELSEGRRT